MLQLHLREVLSTGRLGPLEVHGVRVRRSSVHAALGDPNDFSGPSLWHARTNIWLYADLELHFYGNGEDPTLWMVWCDHIPLPGRQGANLELDPWVLGGTKPVPAQRLEAALWEAGIEHVPRPGSASAARELRLASGWRVGIGHPDAPELNEQVCFIQLESQ